MVRNDQNTFEITKKVLLEVAKLTWAGELDEKKHDLPEKIIPGPRAQFRCCIYREREIIRQRVKLARGICPSGHDTKNIVQVITAACEDCPIQRYTVTNNCQNCIGKACMNSCRFGAIHVENNRAKIDPDKCKECGMCAKACPFNAIADLERPCKKNCPVNAITMDEDGLCVIDESKCIQCGVCVHSCPFNAIGAKSFLVDVIHMILDGKKVIAMVAPATEGQFGPDITMDSWRTALKKTGFADMIELGLGGDLTAAAEAEEWAESYKEGKKMTTSCCPAFVNMIRQHFPTLLPNMSTTVSPMCAVSRMLKEKDPDVVTVFIGPCQAKKSEALDINIRGNADYVLTYDEILAIFEAKGVELLPEPMTLQQATAFGKRFGNSGGVAGEALECMKERGIDTKDMKVCVCSGADECRKALLLLKAGKLPQDFVEGMVCPGGCVGGPAKQKSVEEFKRDRDAMIAKAEAIGVHENLKKQGADKVSMHRKG
jgi:[FeFe] hydrogenase (group B1/B3)